MSGLSRQHMSGLSRQHMPGLPKTQKIVVSGTNVVAMARHGSILKDNEATGSGKVFRYLPGLRDTINTSKMAAKVQKSKNAVFYRIFLYGLFGVSRWDHSIYLIKGKRVLIPDHRAQRPGI